MKGLKYLFKRSFDRWVITLVYAVVTVGLLAAAIFAHVEPDGEDYLICKSMMNNGAYLYIMLCTIYLNVDLIGGRCMRACSIARELYTKTVPLFGVISSAVTIAVPLAVYSGFILIMGRDLCNVSDAMIASAFFAFLTIVMFPFAVMLRYGMVVSTYCYAIPVFLPVLIGVIAPNEVARHGFGLPVWAAAPIFLGAFAVSAAIAFVSARLLYEKGNFKPAYQSQINGQV